MPFKFYRSFGSEILHLDTAVVGHRGEQVRVPGTKGRTPDFILILDQQLFLPDGKILESDRLLVVEEEQITIEELC